jgi:sodium-dependent dicarboxylate transporter 2/3/5
MGEDTTGIAAWVTGAIAPMVSGLTPLVLILLLCVISVVLTNIANNIPVGIVLVTVSVPICMEMGVNPFIAALAISYCANLAYVIPPAFVPVATCYAYPYGGGKYMFRWGLVASVVSIAVCCVMIYPLGLLFG